MDDIGDVTITNDGATILQQLEVEHPAAKVLVELAHLQDQEVGGVGWRVWGESGLVGWLAGWLMGDGGLSFALTFTNHRRTPPNHSLNQPLA